MIINYQQIFNDLYNHTKKCKYKGLDPSILKFDNKILRISNLINKIKPSIIKKIFLYAFFQIQNFCNPLFVRLIKPEKKYYTKGLALIISALAHFNYDNYKGDIQYLIDIILSLKLGNKFVWAHNVDYFFNDRTKITTNTPNLITTYFVGNALFETYIISENIKFLNLFNNIVKDMLTTFPYKEYNNDSICFMYTPNSDYYVHNANILFSELLIKYLYINNINDSNIIELVNKSLNYSLRDFDNSNSFPYAGPPTRNNTIDNYHTGYVLRGLFCICKYGNKFLDDEKIKKHIKKGIDIYLNYFVHKYIYKIKKGFILSTLESHSLAESILIYLELNQYLTEIQKIKLLNSINNTLIKLWDNKNQYFYNNCKILLGLKIYDKTDMIRWSNSWMLYALSKLIKYFFSGN